MNDTEGHVAVVAQTMHSVDPREDIEEDANENVEPERHAARRRDREEVVEGRAVHELRRDRQLTRPRELHVLHPGDVGVPVLREGLRVAQENRELLGGDRRGLGAVFSSCGRVVAGEPVQHHELVRLANGSKRPVRASAELSQHAIRRA